MSDTAGEDQGKAAEAGVAVADALKRAAPEGYLGDGSTVDGLLRALGVGVCQRIEMVGRGELRPDAAAAQDAQAAAVFKAIITGEVPEFAPAPFNTAERMEEHVRSQMPDYDLTAPSATIEAVARFIREIYSSVEKGNSGAMLEAQQDMDDALERFQRLFLGLPMEPDDDAGEQRAG